MKKCKWCKGTGTEIGKPKKSKVSGKSWFSMGRTYSESRPCRKCNGTGRVTR